jgi:hypothetical protein
MWFPTVDDFISQVELLEPKVVFPTVESTSQVELPESKVDS